MQDKTNSIIKFLVRREGLMTTFVSNYPKSSHKNSLENPIDGPQDELNWNRESWNKSSEPERDSNEDQIMKSVKRRLKNRSLKAMGRNRLPNVL
jgi:hypothetical protein